MQEQRNEEYFHRCDKIRYLLLKSYTDKALLAAIKVSNNATAQGDLYLGQRSFFVLSHLCELIKRDLVFNIYKIYFDADSKVSGVKQLNCFMQINKIGKRISTKLPAQYKTLEENIKTMRDTVLAHSDAERNPQSIELDALYPILDKIKNMYNALCDTEIDSRVQPVTDEEIGSIDLNLMLGFLPIIQGGNVK